MTQGRYPLSRRGQDFQKQEAVQSLWDMDGYHIPKRYRNKGKGRGKDKRLARSELLDFQRESRDNDRHEGK